MYSLPRLTGRLAIAASFAALLGAACSPDSNDVSSLSGPVLSAQKAKSTPPASGSALGGAANFVILANAAVTCTDGTITGNVGTHQAIGSVPPGSVTLTTCPIVGQVHVGDAAAIAAYDDFLTAYTDLAPKVGDVCPIITGTLAGQSFAPGTYCVSAEAKTGVLTLNGPATGTWTFKVAPGAFTGTSFQVIMAGGAQACNVTWWVDAATTMTDSDLKGTVLSGAAVTLTRGTLIGRAFAKADVTVTGTAVTGCVGGGNGGGGHDDCDRGDDKGHGHKGHHHKRHHHDGDKHHNSKHHDSKGHDSKHYGRN
jgi:hypothetical protein